MEGIFEFFKEKEIIIYSLSLAIGLKSIITFLSSKPLERQLFSKEKKILYEFVNIFSLFILFPTLTFIVPIIESYKIIEILDQNFMYFLIVLITLYLFIFLKKGFTKIKRNHFIQKLYTWKIFKVITTTKFDKTIILFIIIFSFIVFGSLNATILVTSKNIESTVAALIIFIAIELYIIYTMLIWGINVKLTKPILVNITMDNGEVLKNYYIYNPSDKNFLLIGKDKNSDSCKESVLVKIDKILFCEELKPLSTKNSNI